MVAGTSGGIAGFYQIGSLEITRIRSHFLLFFSPLSLALSAALYIDLSLPLSLPLRGARPLSALTILVLPPLLVPHVQQEEQTVDVYFAPQLATMEEVVYGDCMPHGMDRRQSWLSFVALVGDRCNARLTPLPVSLCSPRRRVTAVTIA